MKKITSLNNIIYKSKWKDIFLLLFFGECDSKFSSLKPRLGVVLLRTANSFGTSCSVTSWKDFMTI